MQSMSNSLKEELVLYKEQLNQVDAALSLGNENEELLSLRSNLKDLIQLTEDRLLEVRKAEVLKGNNLESNYCDEVHGSPDHLTSNFEEDYIGSECRIEYADDCGATGLHNAVIIGLRLSGDDVILRTLFLQPLHEGMAPCQYYLRDKCQFDETFCKFSHGVEVDVGSICAPVEPDYSCLKIGLSVFAPNAEGIWKPATVVSDVLEDSIQVTLHGEAEAVKVELSQLLLPNDQDDASTSESDDESESELQEFIPTVLNPAATCSTLGEWEKHTKGVASRLMRKMGYVDGEGLGVDGRQGACEPVPIQVLPQGKTLDAIMKMREMSEDKDLFNALEKARKPKIKLKKKIVPQGKLGQDKTMKDVFAFLNQHVKREKKTDLVFLKDSEKVDVKIKKRNTLADKSQLKKRTDKEISVDIFKTQEKMKDLERELQRQRQALSRNINSNTITKQISAKISGLESQLNQLKSSSNKLETERCDRKNTKKLF